MLLFLLLTGVIRVISNFADKICDRKRKKVIVTMEQRLTALQKLDLEESQKKVAHDFGVGDGTIMNWIKNHSAIEKMIC